MEKRAIDPTVEALLYYAITAMPVGMSMLQSNSTQNVLIGLALMLSSLLALIVRSRKKK